MKNSQFALGTVLAAVLSLSSISAAVRADDDATPSMPASRSTEFSNIPTAEEARAALMAPISKQPSTGDALGATTGAGSKPALETDSSAAAGPLPSGPIGSFGQTIPAKFSSRNDTLDHVPTMALPLPLSDQQRKQIYDAVMAEKSPVATGAEELKPSSELSPDQAQNDMHPLPESVRGIDGVARLYFVKAKGKVFLVEPATRTVVGEIAS